METAIKKAVGTWFFLAFAAMLAIDVDNSSAGAVCAVFGNFVAAGGVVIRNQQKERREGRKNGYK